MISYLLEILTHELPALLSGEGRKSGQSDMAHSKVTRRVSEAYESRRLADALGYLRIYQPQIKCTSCAPRQRRGSYPSNYPEMLATMPAGKQ